MKQFDAGVRNLHCAAALGNLVWKGFPHLLQSQSNPFGLVIANEELPSLFKTTTQSGCRDAGDTVPSPVRRLPLFTISLSANSNSFSERIRTGETKSTRTKQQIITIAVQDISLHDFMSTTTRSLGGNVNRYGNTVTKIQYNSKLSDSLPINSYNFARETLTITCSINTTGNVSIYLYWAFQGQTVSLLQQQV